jgi:hypothetical protein
MGKCLAVTALARLSSDASGELKRLIGIVSLPSGAGPFEPASCLMVEPQEVGVPIGEDPGDAVLRDDRL